MTTDNVMPVPQPPARPRRGGNPGQGQREDAAIRSNRALVLRMAGASFTQIATSLGYTDRSSAHRAVQRALDRDFDRTSDLRAEYRQLALARLERATRAIWPDVLRGHLSSIDRFLRLSERQSKLLGLDAPTRSTSGPSSGKTCWRCSTSWTGSWTVS